VNNRVSFLATIVLLVPVKTLNATDCIAEKTFKLRQVCGQVVGPSGEVVSDAKGRLSQKGKLEKAIEVGTGEKGYFLIPVSQSGEFELRVQLPIVQPAWQPIILSWPTKNAKCVQPLKIVMQVAGRCSHVERVKHIDAATH
jgi:hypothetical protein